MLAQSFPAGPSGYAERTLASTGEQTSPCRLDGPVRDQAPRRSGHGWTACRTRLLSRVREFTCPRATTTGLLPPSSRGSGTRCPAAARMTWCPTVMRADKQQMIEWQGTECGSGLSIPGHDSHLGFFKTIGQQTLQHDVGLWREFRGLEHNPVAGRHGRGQRNQCQRNGIIPGCRDADHALGWYSTQACPLR